MKSIMNRARIFKLETFRFEDGYDYEYEILSVLISGARTWAVILAGTRDSYCHPTTNLPRMSW